MTRTMTQTVVKRANGEVSAKSREKTKTKNQNKQKTRTAKEKHMARKMQQLNIHSSL